MNSLIIKISDDHTYSLSHCIEIESKKELQSEDLENVTPQKLCQASRRFTNL